jgi:hypothetical protein
MGKKRGVRDSETNDGQGVRGYLSFFICLSLDYFFLFPIFLFVDYVTCEPPTSLPKYLVPKLPDFALLCLATYFSDTHLRANE